MPKGRKPNIKNTIKQELKTITDTVDLDSVNATLNNAGIKSLSLTEKTLSNIAKWSLDGKSEFEIRQNLELNVQEWNYLLKTCPAIVVVMQHSMAYADMVVGGTLYQTAIGGKMVKKKIPMKVHDYNEYGKVIGEHYDLVEVEEETQPNPYLLKFLAEHKLSENFGEKSRDDSKMHDKIIDAMTEEELKAIEEYKKS